MSSLSTHVLDAVRGGPAAGVHVELSAGSGDWAVLHDGETDVDGRIGKLAAALAPGRYRLVFDTGSYFASSGVPTFYPEVVVSFEVTDEQHYHVPLLLSPYAYSTYRGS